MYKWVNAKTIYIKIFVLKSFTFPILLLLWTTSNFHMKSNVWASERCASGRGSLADWLAGCLAGFCGCQRVYQLKRRLINIKPNAIRRPHNLQLFVSPRLSLHLSLTLQPFALCPLSHGIAPPPIQSLNPSKLFAYVCVCAWVLRFGFIQKLKLNFNIFLFAFHLRNSLSPKNTRPQFTQFHTPHLSGAYKDSTILSFFG